MTNADRREMARRILAEEIAQAPLAVLMRDYAGPLACRLYQTWGNGERTEAVVETAAFDDLPIRIEQAMHYHGKGEIYDICCKQIGDEIVRAAIKYVLSRHVQQAEDIEAGLNTSAAEAA